MSKNQRSGESFAAPDDPSPAESKIADSRFRKLIENSREGLRLLDKDLQFIYRSPAAERILGWNENERSIYTIDALVHPDDLKRVKKLLSHVRACPGLSETVDFRSKHIEGHYVWLESTFTNHLADPDINAIVCNFRDVTQQKNDKQILHDTIAELFGYQYALEVSAIVAITDQKGIISYVNDNFCKISKYSREELIGQDHRIVNSGYHDKAFIRELWVTIARGEIWKGELKNKAKDGTYYWVDTTIVPFLNEKGKPRQYIAIRSDITARKLAQEQLQQTIKQLFAYRHAIDESAIVAITNEKGIITHVNENFCHISGFDGTELIGKTHRLINSRYHEKAFFRDLWQTIRAGKTWRGELRNKAKNGSYYWVDATIVPFLDNKGKPYQYIAIRYDITERKGAEAILFDSEKKYRDLFENNPLPLFIWDFDSYKIIDCNTAAQSKYGYTKDEFLRLTTKELRPASSPDGLDDGLYASKLDGKVFVRKRWHQKKNGELIFVEITGQLMTYHGQQMALAMANDITEGHYYHELDMMEKEILEKSALKENVLNDILAKYLQGMESLHPGMICSLLECRGGHLYNRASPALPADYINVVHGSLIGETAGPCSLAAFLNEKIIIGDIQVSQLSDKYKKAARRNALKACWSHPITDSNQQVMAVFACFYKTEKTPTELEQKTIARAINILQVILESYRREQDLKTSNERFEKAMEATFDVIWDWDLDTDTVFYSDNLMKLFGHEAGVHLENHAFFSTHVHPDDLDKAIFEPAMVKYGTMNHWTKEYRFRKACGEYAFVRDRAVVIRDGNGIGTRVIGAAQDITKQQEEEQHLKLLESVITNTTDAVLITGAGPLDEPGPPIVYVNDAFTRMTGYTADELIGKSPRILQGPKSDPLELKKLSESLHRKEPCEVTLVNYKKDGDEFWINIAVSPVFNALGHCTHFIAIERDVTRQKNEELQKSLFSDINQIFSSNDSLKDALDSVLARLVDFGDFSMAEVWLIGADKNRFNLMAKSAKTAAMKVFYESNDLKSFVKEGPFATPSSQLPPFGFWHHLDGTKIMRHGAAMKAGLKSAYIVPLKHNNEVLGVLVFGSDMVDKPRAILTGLFERFGVDFGAEVKRKQLEQELNQIFTLAPDIICIAGVDRYFKKVNPAMSALLGYSEDELLATPLVDFIHPDDRKASVEVFDISNEDIVYFENRYITKSGKTKWLAWISTPPSDEGLCFSVARDVTEKKNLEGLLNKASALARIGAWEIDLVARMVHWSHMTREIHEAPPGYDPDIDAAINFYPEGKNREMVVRMMEDAIVDGTAADEELQIVTVKGNIKWVRVIIETEFADGKCIRVYGSFQDIDARKLAEIASIETLEERNTILESIDDAFFAVNKDWVITYWNNMAAKLTQTPVSKILNRVMWDVFADAIGSESYNQYHDAMKTNQAVHFEDYYAPVNMWYEISAYPSEVGLSVYFKDISERKISDMRLKELNESLQKQTKELAVSNAELEQFAYVASHDLQEPLRMVTSFLSQLEKKYGSAIDDKGKQYIHFAVDGAMRMRQIILDLLDFSRVGRMEEELEEVDFNKLMDDILALYHRQIEELGAHVRFGKLPLVQTYKTPLRQVLQNLIGNSLKYHKKVGAPEISISSKETKTHIQFSVRDNGIGVAPEYFDRIFIIFQRLHTRDEYSGTGMGLAIAKKIIENLGGKIWLKSTEGKGSTFYFTLLKK